MKHARYLAVALTLLLILVVAVPPAGQPRLVAQDARIVTQTFYPQTALTGSSTVYSASPRTVNGNDITRVVAFQTADVFVTGDITSTTRLTVTVQFSADGANWADAEY